MNANQHRETIRRWQRRLGQDLRVLRKLFPWRVGLALVSGIAATAYVFQRAYLSTYDLAAAEFSYIKAVYAILNMATFQVSFADIPHGPKLDLFFILVPVAGIPLLLIFGANLLHVLARLLRASRAGTDLAASPGGHSGITDRRLRPGPRRVPRGQRAAGHETSGCWPRQG